MDEMIRFDGNTCTEIVKSMSPVKVNPEKLCIGMLFNEEEDVHTYYTNYAWVAGLASPDGA